MRPTLRIALAACALAVIACTPRLRAPDRWAYVPIPRADREPLIDADLVVMPLEDQRDNTNTLRMVAFAVPLMLWSDSTMNAPEVHMALPVNGPSVDFRPLVDLSEAVADSLDNARIFRSARLGYRASDAEYHVRGQILATTYENRMWTYGIAVLSILPWTVGLPSTTSFYELEIHLDLYRGSDPTPIWSHTLREEDSETFMRLGGWINAEFITLSEAGSLFDDCLRRGMTDAVEKLEATLFPGDGGAESEPGPEEPPPAAG